MSILNNKWLKISLVVAVIIGIMAISLSQLSAAETLLKWKKLDTMDTNLTIVEGKSGDNDILLELDMEDSGSYVLDYYLEEGIKTTINFTQSYDEVGIVYHMYEAVDPLNPIDETAKYTKLSYLEMDYSLTIPEWDYDGDKWEDATTGLEFSIERSASNKYPGVAFKVDGNTVLIKWDFVEEKVYVLIDDYVEGHIMPIEYLTPNKGDVEILALKRLEDFDIKPTHLHNNGVIEELAPLIWPNGDGQMPGSQPGLEITFKQPKDVDKSTYLYAASATDLSDITAIFELDDIGSEAYLDFNMALLADPTSIQTKAVTNLPVGDASANLTPLYSYVDDDDDLIGAGLKEYKINIVKDKAALAPLANPDTVIQWSGLEASSIYDVTVGFQVAQGSTSFNIHEFDDYEPLNKFAFTYMEYNIQRANIEEAYLDIQAYNAGSQDEIEYSILYSKTIPPNNGDLDIDTDLWLTNYHTTEDGNDEIFIPVPFRSTSSQDGYQVVVNFAGVDIYSQVLTYEAENDNEVPPTTPSIELIDRLRVVPPQDVDSENPYNITFDLVWDAPTNKDIKELDSILQGSSLDPANDDFLYYELLVNDVPTDSTSNPFEVIKVFEVYEFAAGDYRLRDHPNSIGASVASDDAANFDYGYNNIDEFFRMEQISLFDEDIYGDPLVENDGWATVLDTTTNALGDSYTVIDSGVAHDFEFPGVNYIRVRAVTRVDSEVATSQMSIPASIPLSLIKYDIPIVDTLSYEPLFGIEADRTTGVTLNWHSVDISTYEDNMLAPIDYVAEDILYSFYIAEDSSSILPLDDDDQYTQVTVGVTDTLVTVNSTEIESLRNGEVLFFEMRKENNLNKDLTLDLIGLDVNRSYYIRVVTKLEVDESGVQGEPRRSDPSSILSVTVPKIPAEPGDDEIFPLAPEGMNVEYADESLISAGISFNMPQEMSFADDENGFEIIALEDRSLPTELSSKSTTIGNILESVDLENDVVEGWRLFVDGGTTYLKKYNRTTDLWEDLSLTLVQIEGNKFYVIDDANAPNKVNYYYVRTVKMLDDEVTSASPWAVDTLTTAPVKGPINLVIDYNTSFTYEPKEEFIIRFDAPIPNVADVGTKYIMEIHVKGEDDIDYSTTTYPATFLGDGPSAAVGYEQLYYRVSNMVPGKTYSIKIRIEDRTKPQEVLPNGDLGYPKSPYSDLVVSRTEFDQESYDKENKYFEYLNYYTMRAEELSELLYFKITENDQETAVKYRENYAEGMIKRSANDELRLFTDDKAVNTYYFPSNSLKDINDNNVTIVIEIKDQIVGIRPDTIGINVTDEIDKLIDDIERYNSSYEDYYLRIRVYSDPYNGKINNKVATSDLVQVEFGLVESRKLEEELDVMMSSQLDSVINSNKSELIDRLETELGKGINDKYLLGIVEEMVEEVENEYTVQASILFKGNINSTVGSINQIGKSMYVALEPEVSPANNDVYTKQNGVWKRISSSYFNDHYYIETMLLNPYILLPSLTSSTDLVEVYSMQGVDVINTYDLATIFSSYEFDRPSEVVDKYQWISALARFVGATAGTDTAAYLDRLGIDADTIGNYGPLTYDQALDVYIRTYAYRHQIDIDRVYISNYNIVEDLNEVEPSLQQIILQGANLGIVPISSGSISPKHYLNMEDSIELLITLHNGLN